MVDLNKAQFEFSLNVALLILYAYFNGYTVSLGDAWAKKGEGRPHSKNSKHYDKLAIDINLFEDGKYLTKTEDHLKLGKFWEFIGGTWGGHFNDGNHYEWKI